MPLGDLLANYYPHHDVKVYFHEVSGTLLLQSPYFGDVVITLQELRDILYHLQNLGVNIVPTQMTHWVPPLDRGKSL